MENSIKIGKYPLQLKTNTKNITKVYGLILYTESHPHVIKALRDDDYWNALDKNSGNKVAIFAIKPKQGRMVFPNFPKGTIGMMVKIWKEPNENNELIKELGITDTKKLPMLIMFTEFNNDFHYCGYKITSKDTPNTYKSINEILVNVNQTIEKIKPENLNDSESLFREIKGNLDYVFTWKKMDKNLTFIRKIKSFFKII